MPELPEVETVRVVLHQSLLGKKIEQVKVRWNNIIHGTPIEVFQETLRGKTFTNTGRKGKYLYFQLEDIYLIVHLRMEGKFYFKHRVEPYGKHEHIIFELEDGMDLRYDDVRKFGTMELKTAETLWNTHPMSSLGIEPHVPEMTMEHLESILKCNRNLKAVLLDQSLIAGIGNIYANEICYRAKLHPSSICNHLTKEEIARLLVEMHDVIFEAIQAGGTTIRSYTSSLGVTGRFQQQLFAHGKKNEPCQTCGKPIIKMVVAGRGTYLCEICQEKK